MTTAASSLQPIVPALDLENTYRSRREKVLEVMRLNGLGSALFVATGRHLMTEMDSVRWLTGLKALGTTCAILSAEGELDIYLEPEWDGERAVAASRGASVHPVVDVYEALAGTKVRLPQPMGVTGAQRLTMEEWGLLAGVIGEGFADLTAEILEAARAKDDAEIGFLTRATEVAEGTYRLLLDSVHCGMTDVEAAALAERDMRENGAEDAFFFLSAATQNRAVRRPSGRVLVEGDILLLEISPCLGGVFSQICRTVSVGSPRAEVRDGYNLLRAALEAGLGACKAGTPVPDVVRATNGPLVAAGLEQYCRQPYMRTRGHGMGFGSIFPGDLSEESPERLGLGDSFVLHPNQRLPGVGYLMVGDPVVVGLSDGRLMTRAIADMGTVE